MTEPKFPDVTVQLTGTDGNAFAILGKVKLALVAAGHEDVVNEFVEEATTYSYDHLLVTCMKWVNVL
jgi:hypothetical protein